MVQRRELVEGVDEQQQQQPPSFLKSLMFSKLDPHTKSRNQQVLRIGSVYGMALGVICYCTLDFKLAMSGYMLGCPSPTPPMHFNILSLNISSSSSRFAFSVHNPLPFPLHVSLARASLSCPGHHLFATAYMDPFRVPTMTPDQVVMVSADLSSSAGALDAARLVGFEFQVDGLVKIHEGSKHPPMRSMKVVCKDLEVLLSSDITAARLVGGPKKCVQSWGAIY